MAAFEKYDQFAVDLAAGVHILTTAGSLLKIALSNTAPTVATNALLSDAAEIAYTNCNLVAQQDTANIGSETPAGTWDVAGTDIIVTATGAVATFQWVILWNDTPTSPLDPLIGFWNYGSGVTLANGETFTVNFGASMFTVT